MMSPTVVLDGDELVAGLGSGGSNRIRSAIVQAIIGVAERGLDVAQAVEAPRIHLEDGIVQAEPGIDEEALERLAAARLRDRPLERAKRLLRRRARGGAGSFDGGVARCGRSAARRRRGGGVGRGRLRHR